MHKKSKHITVFEHQSLKLNQQIDGVVFDKGKLEALQAYSGEKGVPYYTLTHNGVRFNQYVGVIQVGGTVFEVLPKADISLGTENEKPQWRNMLIDMLFAVGGFNIHAPSNSSLRLKPNSLLDVYFGIFISEVEYLLHCGLVKRYRKTEGNLSALKGNLLFSKHIQHNLTHQERFYVRHTCYDLEHFLHFIIYKTLRVLKQLNTNASLHSHIGALLINFPEMPDVKVSEALFEKIVFNRKTMAYKKAIGIARLLLLKYHPDVRRGQNDVLALMFNMNTLWEQFVFVSLRKYTKQGTYVTAQNSKCFWKSEQGLNSRIRPDIVVNKNKTEYFVLDTKWKNLGCAKPSTDDLRQMYVYHIYYNAKKVALIYPGPETEKQSGKYFDPGSNAESDKECCLISIKVEPNIKVWQESISNYLRSWIKA